MKNIASAFIKAKKAFSPALKEKNNPAFRSKYADLGACIDAVDDALLDNGIAMYQETFEDATGVTVETVLLHESGEVIRSGKLHVPASKQDPQGFGSALTYARRYSLMAACGIAPEDDDGNAASNRHPQPPRQQAPQQTQPPSTYDHPAAIKWIREAPSAEHAQHRAGVAKDRAQTSDQAKEIDREMARAIERLAQSAHQEQAA